MDFSPSHCATRRHEAQHQIEESFRAVDTHGRACHGCLIFIEADPSAESRAAAPWWREFGAD